MTDMHPPALPPAVVLCGGLGTRLRAVVSDRPKALAEVNGQPFLAHLLKHLVTEGIREVLLSAGHLSEQIGAFVKEYAPQGLKVQIVVETEPLGTAGALRLAAEAAGLKGVFLAMNGDTFFTGSLQTLVEAHVRQDAQLTMALAKVSDIARYGAVSFDASSRCVTAFAEKGRSGPGWINAGLYALSPDVLSSVPLGRPISLEREVLPSLIGNGLFAVPFENASFLDIGTPEDLARAPGLFSPPFHQ